MWLVLEEILKSEVWILLGLREYEGWGGCNIFLVLNIIVNYNYNSNDVKFIDIGFICNMYIKCKVYKKLKNSFKLLGVRIGIKLYLLVVMFINNL